MRFGTYCSTCPPPHSLGAEPPSSAHHNLPQLGLAADSSLLGRLRGVHSIQGLKNFLAGWCQAELPALLARLTGAGAPGQPSGRGWQALAAMYGSLGACE